MTGRRLRPGMDRHDLADEVADLLLSPEDVPAGLSDHGPVGGSMVAEGRVDHAVEDPFDNGRRITGAMSKALDGRVANGTVYFRSSDKMDVDSVYQAVRKRLRRHGRPQRQQSNHLVFTWEVAGGAVSVSRYRDDDGMAVLQLSLTGPNQPR